MRGERVSRLLCSQGVGESSFQAKLPKGPQLRDSILQVLFPAESKSGTSFPSTSTHQQGSCNRSFPSSVIYKIF